MNRNKTQIPQNYKNHVKWVFKAYEDAGISLSNGFQKDGIQNATGARSVDRWENWRCEISIVKNSCGLFLIIEDSGTEGLTGPNLLSSEIQKMIDKELEIPSDYRLARFTSMNNSGGNQTGAGLYGVGKTIYSIASEDYHYYFDSLRKDQLYVANQNACGQVLPRALEGNEATDYIKENTGMLPKKSVGTRIIIKNPKQELIDSISSGEMVEYIQESWWRILDRMPEDAGVYVNGEKVGFSLDESIYTNKYIQNTPENILSERRYRVKKWGVFISKNGENKWKGISYYRLGMKIGEVKLDDIPPSIKGKFWGYIEVDKEWEADLAEIEDGVHCGVSRGKKVSKTYQCLKNYVDEKFKALLLEWGYIKNREDTDQKLKEKMQEIATDIQDFFENLGYEDLGTGAKKPDFDVRWQNILYPHINSEEVNNGDKIKFGFRIKNAYQSNKKFQYEIKVISMKDLAIKKIIQTSEVMIASGDYFESQNELEINPHIAEQYFENRIILTVKVIGSNKEKRKELPFYFDTNKPVNSKREVILALHSCEFPVPGSKRVNFNEILKNISYFVENKQNHNLKFKLNVSVHNCEDPSHPKIIDIASIESSLDAFEEIVLDVPDIVFNQEVYEKYLSKGIIELRSRVISLENIGEYEKGQKVTEYKYRIYLNCDEKHGKLDAFKVGIVNDPNDEKRSWYVISSGDRCIYLNSGHYAYQFVKDQEEVQLFYITDQMIKQYILIYLAEGKYSMFAENGEDFLTLDPITINKRVMDKIEKTYFKHLGGDINE
ncbi:MAG: hypothetical protein PHS54_06700 [Clostridia bacterium]|nr:hypothetical protein [Clostridia bacterium]